ncbi:Ku protein [Rarobacter faecitabidus]
MSVPVKIYTATQDHDIALHQVHDEDHGRIRYERRCEVCGKVVEFEHIERAYDAGQRTIVLEDEDLAELPAASRDDIEVIEFVPSDQVDPITFERSYVLEPEKSGVKPYVLLRRTLERTDRTAIVRFALRQKTHLGALRVREGALVLQQIMWADELRDIDLPALDDPPRVSAKEQELADALVHSLEADFRPEEFRDEYRDQLQELIDAKLERGDSVDTAATFGEAEPADSGGGAPEGVIDLMEALKRSVEKSRGAQGAKTKNRAAGKPKSAGTGKSAGKSKAASKPKRTG